MAVGSGKGVNSLPYHSSGGKQHLELDKGLLGQPKLEGSGVRVDEILKLELKESPHKLRKLMLIPVGQ